MLGPGAGENAHPLALFQNRGELPQLGVRGHANAARVVDAEGNVVVHRRGRDVARHDQHGHPTLGQRRLRRQHREAPHLGRGAQLLAEHASGRVDGAKVHLLRVVDAQLNRRHLGRDQHNRRPVAAAFEQAVDEVRAVRPACPGAGRELAGQQGVRAGREAARFLVPHQHPLDLAADAQGIGDVVQRVAGDAVAALDAGLLQRLDDDLTHALLRHGVLLGKFVRCGRPHRPRRQARRQARRWRP